MGTGAAVVTSLAALLVDHPAADDDPLIHTLDGVVSAGAARSAAASVGAALRAIGVTRGMPVAVCLPDGPDFVTAMFGVWLADAVFVPVDDRVPTVERARVLDELRCAAVIDSDGVRPLGAISDADSPVRPAQHGAGVAFVLWTSGTTGRPTPVLHTHDAYLELLDRVLGPLRGGDAPRRPSAPNLVPVALAANSGVYNVLFGLRAGAELVLPGRFTTSGFAAAVHRFGIRSTVLPPTAITMLNDDPTIESLTPLRYVRSITAPLSPLQARRFTERFGVVVLNGYGQAEIGEVIGWTAADAREHPDRIGAVGRPHPGVDIRIDAADAAGVGRLLVRPPNTAVGDAHGSDALGARTSDDGFVDTGDLARVDDAGFVWIEGRAGDVINRGGNKVFPDAVEEVLRLHPGVLDAAVVARHDDRLGEVPVAFVVPVEASAAVPPAAELDAHCREHLVAYKVPVEFLAVDAVPRNDAGKVLRRELRA